MSVRPTWDEYFVVIAKWTSKRSNCIKRQVGCIIVKDNRILSLGYNGTPRGTTNCYEGGCLRCEKGVISGDNLDLCMCLHAEENALLYVGQKELQDATLYVNLMPCIGCVKKIIQCGIKRVVYTEGYRHEMDEMSKSILTTYGVAIEKSCV